MRTTMVPAPPLALAVAPLALAITMRLMMCIVVLFWSLLRSLSWLLHSMCGEVAALPLAVASLASASFALASLALASLALALARACALALVRAALALATLLSRFAALAPSLVLVLFRGLVLVCAGGFRWSCRIASLCLGGEMPPTALAPAVHPLAAKAVAFAHAAPSLPTSMAAAALVVP